SRHLWRQLRDLPAGASGEGDWPPPAPAGRGRARGAVCLRGAAGPPTLAGMSSEQSEFRIEHDTMGEVRVPADALWRAQTQRAVETFQVSGSGLERAQIRALGLLKSACATVNGNLGLLDRDKSGAIVAAAGRIADGAVDAHFPVDVFQTGSGISSNMNTNEVIASLSAAEGVTVHPNDDVNMSQSSNDTFPTATHVAATEVVIADLVPALKTLATSLESRAAAWRDLVKP